MKRKVKIDIKRITIFILSLTMILSVTYFHSSLVSAVSNTSSAIYIDTDQVITKDYEGFGVQWDPSDLFDYTDEQWDSFYEKATFLKPNILRVMLHDGDSYVIGFDDNGQPIYDWDSIMMKRVYKILDFAEENDIPIILGEWRSISERGLLSYDEVGKTVTWDNPIWQKMILDCLNHLIVDKGYTCIKYYNMVNEPNYYVRDNGGTDQTSYDMWKKGITQLREKMDNSGVERIKKIKIVGPDVYDKQEAWIKQAKSDDLKDKIELTEIHRYAPKSEVESGLIETKLKNWKAIAEELDPNVKEEGFALGEMGISGTGPGDSQLNARNYDYGVDMFDYALQATRAGLKFGSVWGFEDSMHVQHNDIVNTFKDKYGPAASTEEGKTYQVHTPTGDPNIDNDIKIWGFWNELGEEMAAQNAEANVTGRANTVKASDEQLKPWYYTWSMFCRYFPSGMQILETTDSEIDQVRATSGIIPRGNDRVDLSIAIVNTSNKEQKVTLNVPNADGITTLNQYYYFDGDRPMNDKGQLEVYDTLKDVDLSEGLEVTMAANSCMIFTTLGYNQESHPMTLTSGQKPAVTAIKIQEQSLLNKIAVGKTYQMQTYFTPSVSNAEIEWKITDYFGNESDIATITADGQLKANKSGSFKVVGYVKGNMEISDTIDLVATTTDILIDDLANLDVGIYENIVRDDNSANFNNVRTIKRSDSNANGQLGIITYEADGIFDFELKAYSLNTNLPTSHNLTIDASQDGDNWETVECQFEEQVKLGSGWYPFTITPKSLDASKDYQYLRVTLTSKGYKTYDPQYAGGTISYGGQTATEIQLANQEKYVTVNGTVEIKASVLPSSFSQDVKYSVLEPNGQSTKKATIDENGILTGKEIGNVVVVVETDDHSLAAYYPIRVVGGYFIDDINNFDYMYDYGSFTYENSESKFGEAPLIKRTSDTPQSIVYAYNQIESVSFETFSNATFTDEQVSIYMSKDGIHYDLIDAKITKIGIAPGSSDFSKYRIEASPQTDEYNFVKFEVKNDSKIYNPMIAKAEIIYNGIDAEATHMNVVEDRLTTHVNKTVQMNVKVAPLNTKASLIYESMDSNIATVDQNGVITGIKTGSTYIKVSLNDKEYIQVPIDILEENLAFKKDIEATSEYNQTDKVASLAVDGDYSTRWGSRYTASGSDAIIVDLGTVQTIDTIKIFWEAARAKDYNIEVAGEDQQFIVVKEMRNMTDGTNDSINISPTEARYVKINGITPVGKYGYSIYELEVYNNSHIINVDNIQFDQDYLELYNGQTYEINIKVNPENATYPLAVYSSSNEDVAIVKNGKIIAVGPGQAHIIAEADEQTAILNVTVVKENSQKIADQLKNLCIQDGKVQLPEYEGYTLSIYSSDHERIIDLDGNVYLPVNNTAVTVVIEVIDESSKKAYTQPILLNIAGNNENLLIIQDFINELHHIDKTLYKPKTIKSLNNVISRVEDTLEMDDLLISDVENAQKVLNDAYGKLEFKEDRTTLNQLLEEMKSIDSQLYTTQSYQSLLETIEKIEKQINDDSSKDDITQAVHELQSSYIELIKQKDFNLLKDKIVEIDNLDLSLYTQKSQKQLLESLKEAKEYLNSSQITTQGLYDQYYNLIQSYGELQIKGNKINLETLIQELEKLDLSKYQSQEAENLKKAIQEVKKQMNDDLTETECLELIEKLQNIYHTLKPVEINSGDEKDIIITQEHENIQNSTTVQTNDKNSFETYMILGLVSILGFYIFVKRRYKKDS